MKRASFISIILSALLIVAGIFTCIISNASAKKEGISLFPEYENGESRQTTEFSSDDVTMIDITVDEANVNIIGGAEKSYIEIVNFKQNYYTFSKSSRALSFNEVPDLKSMLKFWETGFAFTGIRNIIYVARAELGQKVVNVYLSDNDPVRQIKVKIETGSLTIKNIPFNASYNLTVNHGTLSLENIKTDDKITLKSDTKLTASLNGVTPLSFSAELKNASLSADSGTHSQSTDIKLDSGKVVLTTDFDKTNYTIQTRLGKITAWGKERPSPMTAYVDDTVSYAFKLTVTAESADIEIIEP